MIALEKKKSATRFVLLTVFVYSMGFGIIMPVLPELIVELEGVSLSRATLIGGFITAAYAAFQFLLGPLVGNLGDRFGRRPVFLLSLTGFSLDFFLMGFAPNVIWLFVGRSIAGGLGAVFGPANAAMADVSSAADRARGFGMVGAAFGIGFIIGPGIGGLLGDFGTRIPFFAAAGMAFATLIYGYFAFPETMDLQDRRSFSLKRANPLGALLSLNKLPNMLGIALVYFLWVTSNNIYPVVWAFFARAQFNWDSRLVGLSLTLVGLSMAAAQIFLIGRMVHKFGERKTAIIGISAGFVSFIFYAFVSNGIVALFFCLAVGIQGMAMPSINAMMSRRTPSDMQGELQGFNGSLAALGALIAPLIYNTTLSYYTGQDAPFYFAGAPFIVSAILALIALTALSKLKPAAAAG
ncbi:MAG: MFS transporter [Gammaproteobacteria bacterium]|nr:MFS transporter [Gammaproteobacteria bacterium]